MSKTKLSDLTPTEQLDVLSRVYIREVTKPVNRWLAGAVRKAGGEQDSRLNMGKVKNMFLSGSMEANDFAYAIGNSHYETNRFSLVGGLYNYIYRSQLLDELRKSYNIEKGIVKAYSYVKTYGYEDFYTCVNAAFIPTEPSSIINEVANHKNLSKKGLILDERLATGTISLEDFSKEQISLIKRHIRGQISKYMKANGFSSYDIDAVIDHVNRMRTTPYVDKNKTPTLIKKPSNKLEGFLISAPQENITEPQLKPEPQAKPEPVEHKIEAEKAPKQEVKKVNEATGLTFEEEQEILAEIEASEKLVIKPSEAYDSQGVPLCQNSNGEYCYVDGSPLKENVVYDEYGGIYEDLTTGLCYSRAKNEDAEENFKSVADSQLPASESKETAEIFKHTEGTQLTIDFGPQK